MTSKESKEFILSPKFLSSLQKAREILSMSVSKLTLNLLTTRERIEIIRFAAQHTDNPTITLGEHTLTSEEVQIVYNDLMNLVRNPNKVVMPNSILGQAIERIRNKPFGKFEKKAVKDWKDLK